MRTPAALQERNRGWCLFAATAAVRLLTSIPRVIDDDEAWFSVTGYSLKSVSELFKVAIDNKPPGTAWYYYALSSWVDPALLAPFARGVQTVLLAGAAWVFSRFLSDRAKRPWAATALLLGLSAGGPKLLSVTNEGLMVILLILAFSLARASRHWGAQEKAGPLLGPLFASLSGLLMAGVLALKQTGVFFLLPWFFCLGRGLWITGFFSLLLGFGAAVLAAGAQDYWNWVIVYPVTVLSRVRSELFSQATGGVLNALCLGVLLWPWMKGAALRLVRQRPGWESAWLLASLAAVILGKGLFLHYFLLCIPPVLLLAVQELPLGKLQRSLRWVGASAVISIGLASLPEAGVFWGTDLSYHSEVAAHLRRMVPVSGADERVFVWGGNALPLALSGVRPLSGFLTPRFLAGPYAWAEGQSRFWQEFKKSPPLIVVDLHERGDNQFNLPLEALPGFRAALQAGYQAWADPGLPWVKFWLRRDRESLQRDAAERGLCRSELDSPEPNERSRTSIFPTDWSQLLNDLLQIKDWQEWRAWDERMRRAALRQWIERACERKVARSYEATWVARARLWWPSVAVVQLQPVMIPRTKM